MEKQNIIQFEFRGNWKKIPIGFDWYTLREFNRELIYINGDEIIIKNQDARFKYPKEKKFTANHFQMFIENGVQWLYLNPTYLSIILTNKGMEVVQKISTFETLIEVDEHKISSAYCSYYGQPLIIDYEYKNTKQNTLARFVGNNFVEVIVDFNQVEKNFNIKMYDHHILNATYFKVLKMEENLDSISALNLWLEKLDSQFYNIMKHSITNVIDYDTKVFGKRKFS